jgi:hypothetical protein
MLMDILSTGHAFLRHILEEIKRERLSLIGPVGLSNLIRGEK